MIFLQVRMVLVMVFVQQLHQSVQHIHDGENLRVQVKTTPHLSTRVSYRYFFNFVLVFSFQNYNKKSINVCTYAHYVFIAICINDRGE